MQSAPPLMPSAQSLQHREVASLYVDHNQWLQGWLRRKLGDSCAAADLAQDTFFRLLTVPAAQAVPLQGLREPRAYLATVARRLLLNHLRRQSLEQTYLAALAALPEPQAPSPEQQLVILQALQELDAMLDRLPHKVRAVFVLSQVDGLTYAAIAQELGMGLRSVKRYMADAMAECILLAP